MKSGRQHFRAPGLRANGSEQSLLICQSGQTKGPLEVIDLQPHP